MRRTLIVAALALLAIPGSVLAAGPIRGTTAGETITGTAEADVIFARAGDDTVNAGAGDDRVYGGKGVDKLAGEGGNDRLKGNGGKDTLDGGAGDDLIDGRGDGGTADTITCGDGVDTVRASRNDVVADDCENTKQPGAPKAADNPGKGPRGDEQAPFDEDGKSGRDPKAAAAAQDPAPTATEACRAEKQGMGTKLFKQTYAAKSTSKAMAACVAKREPAVATDTKNAAKECKAERTADPAAFAEKYGTNENKSNAYGKCVSSKAEEATEAETEARVNAAKTCKAERAADPAAFVEKYGKNKNKKNALGKCVSQTAKAA
jgi:RTX calcium-binding nonapeptide repeat (4 copies)